MSCSPPPQLWQFRKHPSAGGGNRSGQERMVTPIRHSQRSRAGAELPPEKVWTTDSWPIHISHLFWESEPFRGLVGLCAGHLFLPSSLIKEMPSSPLTPGPSKQMSCHLAPTHRLQPRTPSLTGGKDLPSFRRRGTASDPKVSLWPEQLQAPGGRCPVKQGPLFCGAATASPTWPVHECPDS